MNSWKKARRGHAYTQQKSGARLVWWCPQQQHRAQRLWLRLRFSRASAFEHDTFYVFIIIVSCFFSLLLGSGVIPGHCRSYCVSVNCYRSSLGF